MDMMNTTNINPIDAMSVLGEATRKSAMENVYSTPVPVVTDGPKPTQTAEVIQRSPNPYIDDVDTWSSADAVGFAIAMLLILFTGVALIQNSK